MTLDNSKALHGVWTPWSLVLCVECDYAALKDSPREQHYAKRLQTLTAMDLTAEVERPEGHLIGVCATCHRECWVRDDVALIQQVGFKASEMDWEGPFGWALEQTGGMCAALVFTTDDREVVVTAMDGEFFVGEYKLVGDDDDDRWTTPIRKWQSTTLYRDDALKPMSELTAMVEECAHKVIDLIRNPVGVTPS